MKPIEEAKKFYGDDFDEVVSLFLEEGRYLVSMDDLFVAAYPYQVSLLRQNLKKDVDKPDCWVICFFAGNINRLFDIAPYELPYVVFERNGDGNIKVYETERIKRRIKNGI